MPSRDQPAPDGSAATPVLVTGAAGFVGRHLVAHLESCGDTVHAVDRRDGPDLLDGEGWARLLDRIRPRVVYHLAAATSVADSWDDPVATVRANVEGTLHVAGAALAAGVERFVFVSSSDVYGIVEPAALPLAEDAALGPVTPYAASKAAAEQIVLQLWRGRGLGAVIARAFNHTGPGQDPRFVASALAARVADNELRARRVVPVGDLSARRDFTDVRDVVGAYRLLATAGVPGEVYNVCSGRDVSVRELAELLLADAELPMELQADEALLRPVEIPVLRGSYERLHARTGWRPVIPIERTVADLLADARRRAGAGPVDQQS
ncbi:MAG: GDP-mannose 4,6-dehydratase [Acidimicrobiia bacterium]|nr:GDP-mannose 4,6-dehydratase [Acidimicrobiia bacterium]